MKGIVLRGHDQVIETRARAAGLKVVVSDGYVIPFEKTLFVEAGTRVPFDLLPAAWHFLERWDAAVPLWRYGETAASTGSASERELTRAVVRDLRVLLHSVELLFVNGRSAGGCDLVARWADECERGPDKRLAFLRAVYQVKPRLCVLPTSWLAEVRDYGRQIVARGRVRPANAGQPLVTVELEPGRLVKCHAGDEERVRAAFEQQRKGR